MFNIYLSTILLTKRKYTTVTETIKEHIRGKLTIFYRMFRDKYVSVEIKSGMEVLREQISFDSVYFGTKTILAYNRR